jgi:hypothetical protein
MKPRFLGSLRLRLAEVRPPHRRGAVRVVAVRVVGGYARLWDDKVLQRVKPYWFKWGRGGGASKEERAHILPGSKGREG